MTHSAPPGASRLPENTDTPYSESGKAAEITPLAGLGQQRQDTDPKPWYQAERDMRAALDVWFVDLSHELYNDAWKRLLPHLVPCLRVFAADDPLVKGKLFQSRPTSIEFDDLVDRVHSKIVYAPDSRVQPDPIVSVTSGGTSYELKRELPLSRRLSTRDAFSLRA